MLRKITRKIQEHLGLTRSESAILLFLALGLIIGGSVKLLHLEKATARHDFSESDSFFAEASSRIDSILAAEDDSSANTKGGVVKRVTSPVNINKADLTELTTIPGVGTVIAQRIIDYRSVHGKFNRTEGLRNVKGIGEKTFAKIKEHVRVD